MSVYPFPPAQGLILIVVEVFFQWVAISSIADAGYTY